MVSSKPMQYLAAAAMLCALVACSGGSGGGSDSGAVTTPPPPPVRQTGISLVAGAAWSYAGSADGTLDTAQFNGPAGLTVDASGNIYVVDAGNSTIRKISVGGQVTTLAGKAGVRGMADGSGAQAQFTDISNITVDGGGNLYLIDNGQLRKITPAGVVSTLALTGSASLSAVVGLAIDAASNIYVAGLDYTVLKITPAGLVTVLAGQAGVAGGADGTGSAAQFNSPLGLVLDAAGNLLVADRYAVRKVTPAGVVTTVAGNGTSGNMDGQGSAARFAGAAVIAIDAQGVLYVADSQPTTVPYSVIRKVLPSGLVTTLPLGSNWVRFNSYLAVDTDGNLLTGDTKTDAVLKITPQAQLMVYAGGTRAQPSSLDGAALAAHFGGLSGVTSDKAGNYYVNDNVNCSVRKITPALQVSTVAGVAGSCRRVDGAGATARIQQLGDLSSDPAGALYTVDGASVRKIAVDGTVSTLAGSGNYTGVQTDGVGAAASFAALKSMSSDSQGQLFVSDGQTFCGFREGYAGPLPIQSTLRTVSPNGTVTTLPYASAYQASAGPLKDGPPAVAALGCISALKHDSLDNLYFVDGQEDGPLVLRRRTPDGTLTTLASVAVQLSTGGTDGLYLAPDGLGNIYLAYSQGIYSTVYVLNAQGVTSRVIGTPAAAGDALTLPSGITLGNINGLHYLGNKQLLVITDQSVFKIDLP